MAGPDHHDSCCHRRVGGKDLDNLLTMMDEKAPSSAIMRIGRTWQAVHSPPGVGDMFGQSTCVPHPKSEHKLSTPEPFSTASMLQQLQEIEQEIFDVEAAFRIAQMKGIELSKEDKEEVRAIMQEEKHRTWSQTGLAVEEVNLKPTTPRYYSLHKQVPRHKMTQENPVVIPRKVRKAVIEKTRESTTQQITQPNLLELWDLQERCPQINGI